MTNVAYIYQPHFETKCFRVSRAMQMGQDYNYIVVTCSRNYNGVYKWNTSIKPIIQIWVNEGLPCYCVPINQCEKIKELDELKNPEIIKQVKKQQAKWYKNKVKNRNYTYKDRPEWMLK